MFTKIHAIKTGSVKVKTAQRIRKPGGLFRVIADDKWSEWLPIYAWVIDHPEGVIVVDTGDTSQTTTDPDYFPKWHPYYRTSVQMDIKPHEEIGPQLKEMGIGQKDIRWGIPKSIKDINYYGKNSKFGNYGTTDLSTDP